MTDTELFGEGFCGKVRKLIKTDDEFLPDRIIQADLHTENVRNMMASLMDLIAKNEIIVTNEQIHKIENLACLFLAGSVCLALQSRAMQTNYKDTKYRRIGWKSKSQSLTTQANLEFSRIYNEIGGDTLEKTAFQQFKRRTGFITSNK